MDLQPNTTSDPEAAGPASESAAEDVASPVDNVANTESEATHRNRRSRILSTLNIGRMRHATPDERIEALRRLRNERLANDQDASEVPMSRFSRRFSRAFGSRPTSIALGSRPVSGIPSTAGDGTDFDPRRHGSFAGPTR